MANHVFHFFTILVSLVECKMKYFDLSYSFDKNTVYWPSEKINGSFRFTYRVNTGTYELNRFCASEHGGTHLDAPRHFAPGTTGASDIPLDRLIGPAFIVDVSSDAAKNRDLLITQAHFEAAEKALGRTVDDCIVLLYTGMLFLIFLNTRKPLFNPENKVDIFQPT